MHTSITIRRPEGPIRTSIRLPRSKSVANRALILASLAGDVTCVQDPGDADDTRILQRLLTERPREMHCGAGGTTLRFLMAWACVQEREEHILTGDARLLARPHEPLIDALKQLGAEIERVEQGYRVRGRQLSGGAITFDSPISSQFISAILLVAPTFSHELYLRWTGTRLSEPYVAMTLKVLALFDVFPRLEMDGVRIAPAHPSAAPFIVPGDWSAAAFWYEVAALSKDAEILLEGLDDSPLQGDHRAQELWNTWVISDPVDAGIRLRSRPDAAILPDGPIDLKRTPDLFQPLAFTHAARAQKTTFIGLDNLSFKETDRLRAMVDTLARMGVSTIVEKGSLHLASAVRLTIPGSGGSFDPQSDHRMAMSLAPLALACDAVTIADPHVVNKSYPGFWDDLRKAGFRLEYHG